MRSYELVNEVKMSPGTLAQQARLVDARVGMEFEMIIGDELTDPVDAEYDIENYDQRATSIDDIANFFGLTHSGRVITHMQEQFFEWAQEQVNESWQQEGEDYLKGYMRDNGWSEEVAVKDALETLFDCDPTEADVLYRAKGEHYQAAKELAEKDFLEQVNDEWTTKRAGGIRDDAFGDYQSDMLQDYNESDWLESEGINYMSDVMNSYEVEWPYVADTNSAAIESIANDFKHAIGRDVTWADNYHEATRLDNAYAIEPDGSVGDGKDGLEFISPPLTLDEMTTDLLKVIKWAKHNGYQTDVSTGLHMNVSIPNFNYENVDYIKLVLFSGDQYVLKTFDRLSNSYAKNAMKEIQSQVTHFNNNLQRTITAAMIALRHKLTTDASKLILAQNSAKHVSVNLREEGWVEFRSPGGDWLNTDLSVLIDTMHRYIVALDIACDPNKYQREYATKLYKLLTPTRQNIDPKMDVTQLFAAFTSKKLTLDQLSNILKSNLRQYMVHNADPLPLPETKDALL